MVVPNSNLKMYVNTGAITPVIYFGGFILKYLMLSEVQLLNLARVAVQLQYICYECADKLPVRAFIKIDIDWCILAVIEIKNLQTTAPHTPRAYEMPFNQKKADQIWDQ